MSYTAKDSLIQSHQLKVQRLVIPFNITANASSASVLVASGLPAVLFLNSEGVNQISAVADGSPSFDSPDDSDGVLNMLVQIHEPILVVLHAEVISRTAAGIVNATLANTTGLTALGDKIVLNADTGVDLSTTDYDACLVLEYIVDEAGDFGAY